MAAKCGSVTWLWITEYILEWYKKFWDVSLQGECFFRGGILHFFLIVSHKAAVMSGIRAAN